ncbi:MAG: glycosyltransferase family 39 protein [Candidatus Pacebacteria bacterium]|nr:glycosyltransferase family 39 protein [Candidatus Paceibacterota bacterium]
MTVDLKMFLSRVKLRIWQILILAAFLRIAFAVNLPLGGDEIGCGALYASGQAIDYETASFPRILSLSALQKFINFSPNHSLKDFFASLRSYDPHPPLYYLYYRLFLKYLGNRAFFLRLGSIVFSLLSVFVLYQLGREVISPQAGLAAALMLAVSPYGVTAGILARPYPLIGFLSLATTLTAIRLSQSKKDSAIKNKLFAIYGFLVILSVYTNYFFIFILLAQAFFLMLSFRHQPKDAGRLFLVGLIVVIAYFPWLPSLKNQLSLVRNENHYLYGRIKLTGFLLAFLSNVAGEFIPQQLSLTAAVIGALFILGIIVLGWRLLLTKEKTRFFAWGMIFFLLIAFLGDVFFYIRSILTKRVYYLIIPVAFLLVSNAVIRIKRRNFKNLLLLLLSGTLFFKTISQLVFKPQTLFKTPPEVFAFQEQISRTFSSPTKNLLLVNTKKRRYLLTLASLLEEPLMVGFLPKNELQSRLRSFSETDKFDLIIFANFFVPYETESSLVKGDLDFVSDFLDRIGYQLRLRLTLVKEEKNQLLIFARK